MATYFWVGGTGTWNNISTTNWAATTGGAGGAGVPNNTDTVNFDANSGSGTVDVQATAASLSTTQNNGNITLSLSGSPTLCTAAGTFTHTAGVVTLNTFTLTVGRFISANANARTVNFGTGNITLTANNTTIWSTSNVTNLVFSGTPTLNCTYSGAVGTRTVNPGALGEARSLNVNVSAGTDIFAIGSATDGIKNLTFTGFSGSLTNVAYTLFGNLIYSTGMTLTAGTNATTFAATSGTQQITTNGKTLDFPVTKNGAGALQLQDNLTMGSTRTFTLTAGTLNLNNRTLTTGLFSSSNSNTRAIGFGIGNITVTGNSATIWNTTTDTNFTFTGAPTVNCTYAGATGTRTLSPSSTGNTRFNFYISAGTDVISALQRYGVLDFTGFSGTLSNSTRVMYGDLVFSAGMTLASGTGAIIFIGSSQITTNGKIVNFPLTFNNVSGIFAFQDALTQGATQVFTFTSGTIQFKNGVTSTVGSFVTSGTTQKFLQSTTPGSQATLLQATGTVSTNYLTIRDINATGGATWNAFVDQFNVDAGNNDGWDFGISPIVGGNEYTYQLRSFTQPRRF